MENKQTENEKKIRTGVIVSGIINFLLGIIVILPYYFVLVFFALDMISGNKLGVIFGIIIFVILTVLALTPNIVILSFLKNRYKETNKEINKKKYWLINILIYFSPIVMLLIYINISW